MFTTPHRYCDINFKGHHLVGMVWKVISARSGEVYDIELTDRGMTCTCGAAKSWRSKCKHARSIAELLVSED